MPPLARLIALGALVAGLALPGTASADSGSISNVRLAGPGNASANFSVTSNFCGSSGYCGFFSYARIGAADGRCIHGVGRAIWVSDDIATAVGTQRGTATFALPNEPFKICLWVYQADDREWSVANAVVDPAQLSAAQPVDPPVTQTPPPAGLPAAPAATAPVAQQQAASRRAARLRLAGTRRGVARALRKRYGRTWTKGTARKTTCKRRSATRFRCAVRWRRGTRRYKGKVVVTSTVTRGVTYKIRVKRSRAR